MSGGSRTWVTRRLAELVSGLEPGDVSPAACEMAKRCVLDLVGAAVAGHAVAAPGAMRSLALEMFSPGPSDVWFSGASRHPTAAALANSAAASALDADDGHSASRGHPGASIIPAALAVAAETGASGRDLLAAIAVGYEVAVRVAASRQPSTVDTYATGRWCAYGAAAAAGWLRRTAPEHLAEALAIAGAQVPHLAVVGYGSHKGSGVKEGLPWSTHTGLAAVYLAERGFTGPDDLLDYPSHFDAGCILEGWGERWAVEGTYFKPYACCRWIHAALDALLALRAEHDLRPEEIRRVRVHTFGRALRFGNPTPSTLEGAQFSIPFCLAVAAYEGAEAFLPLPPALLGRPDLLAFAAKVELHVDPALDALFPGQEPARVVLETGRGELVKQVDHPLGGPANPMDVARLEAKFRRLAGARWPADVQDEAIAAVHALEDGGLRKLVRLLRRPS